MIGKESVYERRMLITPEDIVTYYYNNKRHSVIVGLKWEKLDLSREGWYEKREGVYSLEVKEEWERIKEVERLEK